MRNFLIIMTMFFTSLTSVGAQNIEEDSIFNTSEENWNRLIEAIIQVESGGNPRARCGNSVGILQITPICVKECNIILRTQKYSLSDRYNPKKSREMFALIQNKYNPKHNIERAIRLWNGGPRYSIKSTNRYFNKVMKYFNRRKQ